MEWSDELKLQAEEAVTKNSIVKFTSEEIKQLEESQSKSWDSFYGVHQNRFFKDRHWLFTEFPELAPQADAPERVYPESEDIVINKAEELKLETGGRKIFELGSGVGNSKLEIARMISPNSHSFRFSCLPHTQVQQPQRGPHDLRIRLLTPSH